MNYSVNPSFLATTYTYKDIWSFTIGEHLLYERLTLNLTDRYAIAVLKHDVIIGYLQGCYQEYVLCLYQEVELLPLL